jgi:sulfatase maturation enzyme AslB (radical SAM superfamily)
VGNFFEGGIRPLASSVLMRENPLYVQYYVTARCNLRCVQCNVIYANGDQEECTTAQAGRIAESLADIGTSIVLLTGGEPFIRADLVEIAEAFISHGVHPRLQTNGLATARDLDRMAAIGAHDISISLDALTPALQDATNGGYDESWHTALEKVSHINSTFPSDSFCAFGCVLSPTNLDEIVPLIHFATAIGWWVSLVPAHQSDPHRPRSFSTFDPALLFDPADYPRVAGVLAEVRRLKKAGFNLYDSDEYLDDIYRYVTRSPIRWRRRNDDVCDSPNLYFAIQPNGEMAVCCDYRLGTSYPVYDPNFPSWYRERKMFGEARSVAAACSGCMYGSFPEITISARYFRPMLERAGLFLRGGPKRSLVPHTAAELVDLAGTIRRDVGSAPINALTP